MIKKFVFVLAIALMATYSANISFAADTQKRTISVSPAVYSAVAKYKQKNYTGCIQELLPVVQKNKQDALAQYYLGISYAQLGIKDKAQKAYQKVIDLDTDSKLVEYSTRAIACLNEQPQCSPDYSDKVEEEVDDMTVFIKSGKFLHDDVKHQVQEKSLDKVKDSINNDSAPHAEKYKFINDASGQIKNMPTDEEIANAVKVLAKAGFNPYATGAINMQYSNPQLAQLSAIMGNTNSNSSNMNNYLPYILSQEANQNPEMTKQMMQTMMMSQMMPSFGFNSNSNGSF